MKWHFSQSSYGKNRTLSSVESTSILDDIERTRLDLEMAYSGFDNVTDPDLIDCYIFEVNAVLKRYKYLLEQAAKMNLLPSVTWLTAMKSKKEERTSILVTVVIVLTTTWHMCWNKISFFSSVPKIFTPKAW